MIEAENISKYYQLGALGAQSFKEDLRDWWTRKLKKPAPQEDSESMQHIWALQDISFNLMEGEVMGLVGKNGAGKSTLLKIISRITLPSRGRILGRGRIASLIEVGAGFHGELTGRENIYLNGHIMGMKKREIDRKFDEIIDFSGIARFLDTPVKRYSSGMYVRLAFAVAAHLDPEILVIDEVLAVGDLAFQKKCLLKIQSIAREEGKTILFVSHNIQSLRSVCNQALLLEKGKMIAYGDPDAVIARYGCKSKELFPGIEYTPQGALPGNKSIRVRQVKLVPAYIEQQPLIDVRTPLAIQFEFFYQSAVPGGLTVNLEMFNYSGDCIFELVSEKQLLKNGLIQGVCNIPGNFLNTGVYHISLAFISNQQEALFYLDSCLTFEVEDFQNSGNWSGKRPGIVRPSFPILLTQDQPLL